MYICYAARNEIQRGQVTVWLFYVINFFEKMRGYVSCVANMFGFVEAGPKCHFIAPSVSMLFQLFSSFSNGKGSVRNQK